MFQYEPNKGERKWPTKIGIVGFSLCLFNFPVPPILSASPEFMKMCLPFMHILPIYEDVPPILCTSSHVMMMYFLFYAHPPYFTKMCLSFYAHLLFMKMCLPLYAHPPAVSTYLYRVKFQI